MNQRGVCFTSAITITRAHHPPASEHRPAKGIPTWPGFCGGSEAPARRQTPQKPFPFRAVNYLRHPAPLQSPHPRTRPPFAPYRPRSSTQPRLQQVCTPPLPPPLPSALAAGQRRIQLRGRARTGGSCVYSPISLFCSRREREERGGEGHAIAPSRAYSIRRLGPHQRT